MLLVVNMVVDVPVWLSTLSYYLLIISVARVTLAGVYHRTIAARLPRPILARVMSPGNLKPDKIRKLHENVWYSCWHSLSFFVVLRVIWNENWFGKMLETWDPRWTYYSFPHPMEPEIASVYLLELAFWVSCLLFMAVETLRKDVVEMFVHHVATIMLIGLSYLCGYHRIGLAIMAIHDSGDILLYSAKVFNYLGVKSLTNVLFVLFVVVFFVSRLVIFPAVIRVAWGPTTGYIEGVSVNDFTGSILLPGLLTLLLALHCMWFVLILKMLYNMCRVQEKSVGEDIRSEDEDTATPPEVVATETRKRR